MPADIKAILKLEVPLIVEIARREMSVKDVLSLAPGAIVELPKLADEELEVVVSDKVVGVGRAVKVGENFGVRITYVGDIRSRIKAMGRANSKNAPPETDPGAANSHPVSPQAVQALAAGMTAA